MTSGSAICGQYVQAYREKIKLCTDVFREDTSVHANFYGNGRSLLLNIMERCPVCVYERKKRTIICVCMSMWREDQSVCTNGENDDLCVHTEGMYRKVLRHMYISLCTDGNRRMETRPVCVYNLWKQKRVCLHDATELQGREKKINTWKLYTRPADLVYYTVYYGHIRIV